LVIAVALLALVLGEPPQQPNAEQLARDGEALYNRGDHDGAARLFEQALAAQERAGLEDSLTAALLSDLGLVVFHHGELDRAQALHERAISILEQQGLSGREMVNPLSNLGQVFYARGDLVRAQSLLQRAVSILEKVDPGAPEVPMILNNLGTMMTTRGELDEAEATLQKALAVTEKLYPDGRQLAAVHTNLGNLAQERGDLRTAERQMRRALAITERLNPHSMNNALHLSNLGRVVLAQGDVDGAEEDFRLSLAMTEELAPDGLRVADELTNVATILAEYRGDLAGAQRLNLRALAIREKQAPDSEAVALSLYKLGRLAVARGDLDGADAYYRRSLALMEARVPRSPRVTERLTSLAEVALARGRLDEAQELLRRAIALLEGVPGTLYEARARHALGQVLQRQGRLAEAATSFGLAVDAIEAQVGKLGTSREDEAGFRARWQDYYRDLIDALLALKRPAEAFHVLERSRAQAFLEMLAGRETELREGIPEEEEKTRRSLGWRYDRLQAQLAQREAQGNAAAAEDLRKQLVELRRQYIGVVQKLRDEASPAAALRYPRPLDVDRSRAALDPGTLLLAYSVGREKTHLFILSRDGGLRVEELGVGEAALQEDVRQFRGLVQEARGASPRRELMLIVGRRLFDQLIAPAAGAIDGAARLLVIPDGPLHVLPFAALVRDVDRNRAQPHYLVEWKPVHVVLSCTVYEEIRRPRQGDAHGPATLVAFGDPAVGHRKAADASVSGERSVLHDLMDVEPLLKARAEVEQITALFPGHAQAFVGAAATEEQVKALRGPISYLHFATHGLIDPRSPLDSALVLSIPEVPVEGRDNGLLQAWEVFGQVRVSADLVVLSSCESGLGTELRGEGLVGLVRAFQYAGARTVAATLWRVPDEATAALMARFYRALKDGASKDEALRSAQLALVRGAVKLRSASSPYAWAGFQLYGDWR
jgi:CHAT domain-containing protein/Tfp pilus assembly protein PilF